MTGNRVISDFGEGEKENEGSVGPEEKNIYKVKPMEDWRNVKADLVLTDPPFGLDFDGKASNYNRDEGRVVDGYVEWETDTYAARIDELLETCKRNTTEQGQVLIFSGWNNSHIVHQRFNAHSTWRLEGKLYWEYNFAPYCSLRPAHNVYEIFWGVKSDDWYYDNECSHEHCQEGEANLSAIDVKRNYLKEMPKYPTRLPPNIVKVLLEHFTQKGDRVFDPLAGAGTVGIVAEQLGREFILGDLNKEAKGVYEETKNHL